jgi:hypothetical protein
MYEASESHASDPSSSFACLASGCNNAAIGGAYSNAWLPGLATSLMDVPGGHVSQGDSACLCQVRQAHIARRIYYPCRIYSPCAWNANGCSLDGWLRSFAPPPQKNKTRLATCFATAGSTSALKRPVLHAAALAPRRRPSCTATTAIPTATIRRHVHLTRSSGLAPPILPQCHLWEPHTAVSNRTQVCTIWAALALFVHVP